MAQPLYPRGDDGPAELPGLRSEARAEVLLDRLATLGLGGPLFSSPVRPDSSESTGANTTEEPIDPEAEEIEKLLNSWRRRPSKLADALTRKAHRDYNRAQAGPSVKWIPKVKP